MRRLGASYRTVVTIVRPALMLFTRRDWRGAEHLPRTDGFVVCVNHVSHLDPFTFGHFLYDQGVVPRFLGKESMFRIPLLGRIVAGAGQIPVYRESADAGKALRAAIEAVRQGECVAIYPEATLTRDPGLWPMAGKSGAARVALATGCPVIPVAQWGVQEILAPYASWVRLLPRKRVQVWAGPPVDLSRFTGRDDDPQALQQATDLILDAITELLEQIRGERRPAARWDPRDHELPRTGNPKRAGRGDR